MPSDKNADEARLALISVRLLEPEPEYSSFLPRPFTPPRPVLDESNKVEFFRHVDPLRSQRFELIVDGHAIVIQYDPPEVNPDTPQWEQVSPIAYRKLGTT